MMLALWSLFGLHDVRAINAARTLLGASMNTVAVVCFVLAGKVWWPQTMTMLVEAVIGGYAGARVARRLDPQRLRATITRC